MIFPLIGSNRLLIGSLWGCRTGLASTLLESAEMIAVRKINTPFFPHSGKYPDSHQLAAAPSTVLEGAVMVKKCTDDTVESRLLLVATVTDV